MRTAMIPLFLATLTACALESGDEIVVPVAPDAGVAETDAGAPCPDATPPDAAPDVHEIYCTQDGIYFSTTVELRGNLKTGLVDPNPTWTPDRLGYGADYGGFGWPPPGAPANPASYVGSVVADENGAWKVFPQVFEMFNDDALTYVNGLTPYIASADGQVKWILMDKWTIPAGQYCMKSPSGTKLCECWATPCDATTAYPGCEN